MTKTKKLEFTTAILFVIGIIVFIFGFTIFLWNEFPTLTTTEKINSEKIAQIGDFIGGIAGSVWALAGVLLFYLALKEQRKDIKINQRTLETQVTALNQQIDEFRLQTNEFKQTREVFEEQSKTLRIQRFENTFFQLLHVYQELIDKLSVDVNEGFFEMPDIKEYEKAEVFEYCVRKLNKSFDLTINYDKDGKKVERTIDSYSLAYEFLERGYMKFYFKDLKQILSHYYRTVYHIFKFILLSDLIAEEKKQFYASIVRAQLSSDELYLILYNSLIQDMGKPKFLFLIKKFDILQNFDLDLISDYKYHVEICQNEIEKVENPFIKKNVLQQQ